MNAVGYYNKMGWNFSNIRLAELEQAGDTGKFYRDLNSIIAANALVKSYGGLEAAQQEAHKDCFAYNKELLAACYLVNQCS